MVFTRVRRIHHGWARKGEGDASKYEETDESITRGPKEDIEKLKKYSCFFKHWRSSLRYVVDLGDKTAHHPERFVGDTLNVLDTFESVHAVVRELLRQAASH